MENKLYFIKKCKLYKNMKKVTLDLAKILQWKYHFETKSNRNKFLKIKKKDEIQVDVLMERVFEIEWARNAQSFASTLSAAPSSAFHCFHVIVFGKYCDSIDIPKSIVSPLTWGDVSLWVSEHTKESKKNQVRSVKTL